MTDAVAMMGETGNLAAGVFADMTVAEEEIAAAKRRYPEARERLDSAFRVLQRPAAMRSMMPEVYRQHVRELLDRVARGEDLQSATDAEVLAALSETSLTTRLNSVGQRLMADLMARVMADSAEAGDMAASLFEIAGAEDWPGQTMQELRQLRQRCGVAGRKLAA